MILNSLKTRTAHFEEKLLLATLKNSISIEFGVLHREIVSLIRRAEQLIVLFFGLFVMLLSAVDALEFTANVTAAVNLLGFWCLYYIIRIFSIKREMSKKRRVLIHHYLK